MTLEDENGNTVVWRIVGPDEFDLSQQKLSCDSPLAQALLGKGLDAEIELESPSGPQYWCVMEVRYEH